MGKTKDGHPGKDFSLITQLGLKALALATEHTDALRPRLPAGLIEGLGMDLQRLGAAVPGAKTTHAVAKAATVSQEVVLAQGHALVTAIRALVQKAGAEKDVRKAFGVGVTTNIKVVKHVRSAIAQIVERATKFPAEACALGILPKDIEALRGHEAAITAADDAQELSRAGAPQSTKDRNRAANRIVEASHRIAAAGALEYANEPAVRAQFEALNSGSGRPKKGKAGLKNASTAPAKAVTDGAPRPKDGAKDTGASAEA